MRWITGPARTAIGLDVGGRNVKAAQLVRAADGWSIAAVACFPRIRPDADIDEQEVGRICNILSRQGFTGAQVILPVPPDRLLSEIIELPSRLCGTVLEEIARSELGRMHKYNPHEIEISCWRLPEAARAGETSQVMALACPHSDAESLMSIFEGAGLSVRALDTTNCALVRACDCLVDGSPRGAAILDIGWTSAKLILLHEGVIIYERTLAEGGTKHLAAAMTDRFALEDDTSDYLLREVGLDEQIDETSDGGVPFGELRGMIAGHIDALASALEAPFSYIVHQYREAAVDRLLLVGGGASIPGVVEYMAEYLNMKVLAVAPKDAVESPASLNDKCESTALTLAVGLASFVEE